LIHDTIKYMEIQDPIRFSNRNRVEIDVTYENHVSAMVVMKLYFYRYDGKYVMCKKEVFDKLETAYTYNMGYDDCASNQDRFY